MKNIILLILLSLMFETIVFGQNAFYDALKLKQLLEPGTRVLSNDSTVYEILANYIPKGEYTQKTIVDFYDGEQNKPNPFISYIGEIKFPSTPSSDVKARAEGISLSALRSLNVNTYTDVLSQFLIDRAKQELNIAFFNRLKVFFEDTPEIEVLFPKSSDVLKNLLSYQYTIMINSLRNAFQDDLKGLFLRTDDIFKLPKYRPFINEFPEVILSLKTIQVIAQLDNERHPADILGDFKDIPEWKEYKDKLSDDLYNFHSALEIGHLISQSLRFVKSDIPIELFKHEGTEKKIIIQDNTGLVEAIKKSNGTYDIKNNIRELSSDRAWITRQHLNYLIQDPIAFEIYLGLLYQASNRDSILIKNSIKKIKENWSIETDRIFYPNTILKAKSVIKKGSEINGRAYDSDISLKEDIEIFNLSVVKEGSEIEYLSEIRLDRYFYEHLQDLMNDYYMVRDYLVEFTEIGEEVDKTFEEIEAKQKNGEIILKEELYKYINTGIDLVEYATDVSSLFQKEVDFQTYIKIARNGNGMYLNTVKEEYAAAVNNLVSILEAILQESRKNQGAINKSNEWIDQQIVESNKDMEDTKFFSTRNATIKREIKDFENQKEFHGLLEKTSKILKYGTFMANIVQSDSAEEIRAAIEAAALPVGSYTIKRFSRWNVSFNAYLGGSYGFEKLRGAPKDDKWSPIFGVHAPVGITGSYGLISKKGKTNGSISAFLTILDIGAVTQFRLQNPIVEVEDSEMTTTSFNELPEIKLENIFAPGGYLVYGFPSLPISLGCGWQYGPALRGITINQQAESNQEILTNNIVSSSWSWRLFIAVDIPLLNLYSR